MKPSDILLEDEIRTGAVCEYCNKYFINKKTKKPVIHNRPVVCHDCWDKMSGYERQFYRRAKANTITV